MNRMPTPTELLAQFRDRRFRTLKRLGQHFLTNEALLARIAEATEADERSLVLEIGPGPGTLTALLRERAGGVLAIEVDKRLEAFYEQVFPPDPHLEFIFGDALRMDPAALARSRADEWGLDRLILAGNIPFQITSHLLFAQARPDAPWSRIVLTIQREVADRLAASPRTSEYGILTVKLAYWWRLAGRWEFAAKEFFPRPKVDSSLIALEPASDPDGPTPEQWPGLSSFIDRAFNQRRKKLYNSPGATPWGREATRDGLEALGLNPDARAEELSPADFHRLYVRLAGSSPRCE